MVQQYTYSRSPDHPYALEMLPMSTEELNILRVDAKAAYDQLFPAVQAAVRFGTDGEVFNVTHRRDPSSKSQAMWTTSELHATLEEVAALYLDQNRRVPIVLDSARSRKLYELEKPSQDRPLHGAAMRWSLWKPPSKLSDGRDVCFLEYMDSFVERGSGRRVWARGMRSINHLSCPASQHPEGPVRTYLRVSGMIFRETDRPNVLEHVTLIHVDGRNIPNWVVHQVIAASKKAAENLNQVLKIMRQLKPQIPRGMSSSIGSNEGDGSRDCKACGDRVSKWTIAKRCRFCDAVLCKRCIEICYHRVEASGKNHRMCLSCALYTGSVNSMSRSLSGLDYISRPKRVQNRVRNASGSIVGERKLSEKASALVKQTSLPTYSMQSSVGSESECPSIFLPDSAGSGSREDTAVVRENLRLYSPTNSMNSTFTSSDANDTEWPQRSCSGQGSRAFTLDLEPRRAEPIDLSYLTELVTPRAGATRI